MKCIRLLILRWGIKAGLESAVGRAGSQKRWLSGGFCGHTLDSYALGFAHILFSPWLLSLGNIPVSSPLGLFRHCVSNYEIRHCGHFTDEKGLKMLAMFLQSQRSGQRENLQLLPSVTLSLPRHCQHLVHSFKYC